MKLKKILTWTLLIVVISNFFLFIFTVISWYVFLIVLGLAYAAMKWGLPRIG